MDILHFAPEGHIRHFFDLKSKNYSTSSFNEKCDYSLDITNIDMPDKCFDLVIANHVLEHVAEEQRAIQEVKRILKPGGIAVLPVPIYGEQTVEYGEPLESGGHWRAPGLDYFNRLEEVFNSVRVTSSSQAPPAHQTFLLENRSGWPTKRAPKIPPSNGWVFEEYVPICFN